MTGILVFAVAPAGALDATHLQAPGLPTGLALIGNGALAAVVSEAPDRRLGGQDRNALLPWLLSRQKVLEHLLARGPVLPVALGTVVETEERVRHLLDAGAPALSSAFRAIGDRLEMNLSIRWPLDAIVAELLAALPAELRAAAASECTDAQARRDLGAALATGVEHEKLRVRRCVSERLRAIAPDMILSEPPEPHGVLNLALLLDPAAEDELDRALDALDSAFENRLTFRLVGPLPPYSFASVQVNLASAETVAEARATLGIRLGEGRNALKSAYRSALRSAHPDLVAMGNEKGESDPAEAARVMALTAAYRVLEAEHVPVSVLRQDSLVLA